MTTEKSVQNRNSFYAKDRKAWRNWLKKNHKKETIIWLIIYHKASSTPSVYYDEAVEEALCFGWIDSTPNKTGTWTAMVDVENSVMPDDLQKAFKKNKTAFKNYEAFPPSSKKIILQWVLSAKRAETRTKRIEEIVTLAAKNIRANHYKTS